MRKILALSLFMVAFCVGVQGAVFPATVLPTTDNPYMQRSLNGEWKFHLVDGAALPADASGWCATDYNDTSWSSIIVPGCWETQGYCSAAYGKAVPERHGLYRKKFTCPVEWTGADKRIILRVEAASLSYRCFVNGHEVGEYDRAHLPCNFDITPYLYSGKDNILCIDVSTRGGSWLFDVVDNWTYCGINRDVSVFCVNDCHISDLTFTSEISTNGDATFNVKAQVAASAKEPLTLTASMKEPSGRTVWASSVVVDGDSSCIMAGKVEQPLLWTAETPALYDLRLRLSSQSGRVLHCAERQVGLRDVRVEGKELLLNGHPILLHGVCVSEAHPYLGAAYTEEEWRHQLEMMKKANINFIRTAHYPMHPSLYKLADELGFYICDEIPFASRGSEYLKAGTHLEELFTRAEATINRDKNHPSVIMWSIGNENSVTVGEVIAKVRELDPSRPRGVPQTVGPFSKMLVQPHPDASLLMGHYFNQTRLNEVKEKATMPFVQTEYAHSLGLGMGDFQDRWQRILDTDGFAGGAVWCWQDGGAVTSECPTKVCKGVWVDSLHYLDGYGYDMAKDTPERGKEAIDGIVYANGYPQEDYYLVRKLYSPVQLLADTLQAGEALAIANRNDFVSLEGYTLHWRLTDYAAVLAAGEERLHAAARATESIDVSRIIEAVGSHTESGSLAVEFVVTDPAGKAIHERTLPVGRRADYAAFLRGLPRSKQYEAEIDRNGSLVISHKRRGTIVKSPFCLRIGRPLTVTGLHVPGQRDRWSQHILTPQVSSVSTEKTAEGKCTTVECRWYKPKSEKEYIDGVVRVTVLSDGAVNIDYSVAAADSMKKSFTEVGLTLLVDKSADIFRWLGRGPCASTPDKYMHNEFGLWALRRDDYRFCGNRGGVEVACLCAPQGGELYIVPQGGNVGIENWGGGIALSHNIWVTGIGSKSAALEGMLKASDMRGMTGSLLLKPMAATATAAHWQLPFRKDSTVIAENPFYDSYGW